MLPDLDNREMQMELRDWSYLMTAYVRQYLYLSKNQDPAKVVFIKFPTVQHPYKPEVKIPVEYIEFDSEQAKAIMYDGSIVPVATEADIEKAEQTEDRVVELKSKLAELEKELADIEAATTTVTPAPEDLLRQQQEDNPPPEAMGTTAPSEADDLPPGVAEPGHEIATQEEVEESISPARAAYADITTDEEADMTPEEKSEAELSEVDSEPAFVVGDSPPPEGRKPRAPANPAPDIPGVGADIGGGRDKRDQRQIARDVREGDGREGGFPKIEEEEE